MAQRYICTEPAMGANFYQTYAPTPNLYGTPTYGGPDQLSQLGIFPGLAVNGSFNTKWMLALSSATTPAMPGGTAVPCFVVVGPAGAANLYQIVGASTANTIDATSLATFPTAAGNVGTGMWVEISGIAPLNPAPMGFETSDNQPEPTPPNGEGPPPVDGEGPGNLPGRHRPARQHILQP